MEKPRRQTYLLAGALLLALLLYVYFRPPASGPSGTVAADQKFQPLDVQEPELRLDLIERLHKIKYEGTHRNIFSAIPPPPPVSQQQAAADQYPVKGPHKPAPPPPPQFAGQFFGTATIPSTGAKMGFFQQGEDVSVVAEGGVIFGTFRLKHIGNDSATLEELSTGRTTTVPLQQPSDQGNQNQGPGGIE